MKTLKLTSPDHGGTPYPVNSSQNTRLHEVLEIKQRRTVHLKRNSRLFLGIGFCISFLAAISAFQLKIYDAGKPVTLAPGDNILDALSDIKNTVIETPPPPKIEFPKIEVVDNGVVVDNKPIKIDVSSPEGMKVDEPVKVNAPEIKDEPVETAVIFSEIMPEPEGGLKAFYEFVGKNIKYPDGARRLDIEGRVTVQFIVEKDGSLTDIKVLKGIGGGCDEEALRVIGMAPKWHPGMQSRKPVRVLMSLPVVFRLNH